MLTPEGQAGSTQLGEVIDLSPSGAGILVPEAVPRGTRVSLLLDGAALPASRGEGGIPAIAGVVASMVTLSDAGVAPRTESQRLRIGIAFLAPNVHLECRLSPVDPRLPHGGSARRIPHQSDLAATPEGREQLYQCALANLRHRHLSDARKAAKLAVIAEPKNSHYRALLFRVIAEEALAGGALTEARRCIARARTLLPVYPELGDLEDRIDRVERAQRGANKGLFVRLFG